VFGAGAIGTYIGGSLALRANPVVFLERPEVAADLRQRGLRLKLAGQEQRIANPQMAASLEEALACGPFDAAIFALKSYDTQAVLHSLAPFAGAVPPILCLQNGVDNEPAIAATLGTEKVIAGTVTSAVGRRAAGDIVLERLRGIGVAAGQPLSEKLVAVLDRAGLNARLYPNAADLKWSKLLTNLLGNATSAILDMPPAEVFSHPGLYRLEIEQLREALRVMDAQGIKAVDLPGTPVRALALAGRALPPAVARPFLQRAVGGGRGGKMPSFHIDLYSGRGRSEVEYLNGAVARFGERLNIPTPVNHLLTTILISLTIGATPPEQFSRQPGKLLQALKDLEKVEAGQ
jgi:2-dehydropantoate 2-reductase